MSFYIIYFLLVRITISYCTLYGRLGRAVFDEHPPHVMCMQQERGYISTFTSRLCYVLASAWIAFIAFCRMYLGMHTVGAILLVAGPLPCE